MDPVGKEVGDLTKAEGNAKKTWSGAKKNRDDQFKLQQSKNNDVTTAKDAIVSKESDVGTKSAAYEQARQAYQAVVGNPSTSPKVLMPLKKAMDDAKTALDKAKTDLLLAQTKLAEALRKLSDADRALGASQASLDRAQSDLDSAHAALKAKQEIFGPLAKAWQHAAKAFNYSKNMVKDAEKPLEADKKALGQLMTQLNGCRL